MILADSSNQQLKKLLLMKHPNFFAVKKMQTGQLKVNDKDGNYLCFIGDVTTPINIKNQSYYQLLQICYKIAECIDIIYNNLNLQLNDFNIQDIYQQDNNIIFCPFDQISSDGQSEQKIINKIIKDIQFYSGINLNIEHKYKSAQQFINSDIFQSGSFSILKEINNTTKIQSQEYIQQLYELIQDKQVDVITILQHISPILLQNIIDLQLQIEKYLPILILIVNQALQEDKQLITKITPQFNQLFTYLCDTFNKKPQTLINITKITYIKQLPDTSANSFANLATYVLKKSIIGNEYQILTTYFIKQLNENIQIFIRYIKIQTLNEILIKQIKLSQKQNNQLAQNCYEIFIKIINYNQQYKERTNEDAIKIQTINVFKNDDLFQCCIDGIQNGTQCYQNCIQLIQLSLDLLGTKKFEIDAGYIGLLLQSINSVKCLHLGILNYNTQKRQQSQQLYDQCLQIGLEITKRRYQQAQQDKEVNNQQSSQQNTENSSSNDKQIQKQEDQFVNNVIHQNNVQWNSDSESTESSSQEKIIQQKQENKTEQTQQSKQQWSESSDDSFSEKKQVQPNKRRMTIKKINASSPQQDKQQTVKTNQNETSSSSDDSW